MSSGKRALLTSDDNAPKLREPKPPFGLERGRWIRLRVKIFGAGSLILAAFVLWVISQRNAAPDEHRIQGQRLAAYYEVSAEHVGCETPLELEGSTLIGIHQGFATGPVLVECSVAQECETVSARDPELSAPGVFLGPAEDVMWADYAAGPAILLDADGVWKGTQTRTWNAEERCHTVTREEILALEDGRLSQSVEIRHAEHECSAMAESQLCVYRRVRELRTPRP